MSCCYVVVVSLILFDGVVVVELECFVVGVDEVGRGLLVGLVVVVVVVFDLVWLWINGLDDFKQFIVVCCEQLYDCIIECVLVWYVVLVDVDIIDCLNIYQVILQGMCDVVVVVVYVVGFVCIDGNVVFKGLVLLVQVLVGGDGIDCVIMVVLILVKVLCDCYMQDVYVCYL